MTDDDHYQAPSLATLLRRIGSTSLGILRNRAELLSVELEEEKARRERLLILSLVMMSLGVLAICLATATVIMLVPVEYRVYTLGGFAVLYGAGCLWAWIGIKGLLKKQPFAESIDQLRKDAELLERSE